MKKYSPKIPQILQIRLENSEYKIPLKIFFDAEYTGREADGISRDVFLFFDLYAVGSSLVGRIEQTVTKTTRSEERRVERV